MQPGDTIRHSYRLESILGQGAGATTFLALNTERNERVVLKAISLSGLRSWTDFDSLEREARVLAGISHPRIPRYIDSFSIDQEGGAAFFLVQQYIPGQDLERRVERGWRGTDEEIRAIAAGLLRIVRDIHALRPPVIHRDINPRNVVIGEEGEVYLVDFGGVQEMVRRESTAGMTVMGTPGYVPLEQFGGNASERSDLYACGATILFLLTHRNPADLPSRNMRIDFRSVCRVSPALGYVLDRFLEPDEARRTLEPGRAIEILETGEPPAEAGAPAALPYGSRIRIERGEDLLTIVVPERGGPGAALSILGFGAFWLLFVAVWTGMSIAMGAPVFFPLFSVPFWVVGIVLLRRGLRSLIGRTVLRLSAAGLRVSRNLFLPDRSSPIPLEAVAEVGLGRATGWQIGSPSERSGERAQAVQIHAGAKTISFGELLSPTEKTWLRDTIRAEIARLRG